MKYFSCFTLLLFFGCGTITFDKPTPNGSDNRRIYVNDSAAADSLSAGVVESGIKLVMQPNKTYQFSIRTDRTEDRLQLFYYNNGPQGSYKNLPATLSAGKETFSLASDQSSAQFFLAQLVVPDGIGAIKGIRHVSFVSQAAIGNDTLNIRLIFVRQLKNLPSVLAKADFANSLFSEMKKIYANYGIVMNGTYDIVEPGLAREVFAFTDQFVNLSGTRVANNAHMYLVDTITIGDSASGLKGEILGFAPREVKDIDQDPESRVILANPYTLGISEAEAANRLATTAVHELGHFFGLRHTVSTLHDILQDDDGSNKEDGFTDTRFCDLQESVTKLSATQRNNLPPDTNPFSSRKKGGPVYCLRILGNSCNAFACDLTNLMHPIDCGAASGVVLSKQQINFLKKNLATFRH